MNRRPSCEVSLLNVPRTDIILKNFLFIKETYLSLSHFLGEKFYVFIEVIVRRKYIDGFSYPDLSGKRHVCDQLETYFSVVDRTLVCSLYDQIIVCISERIPTRSLLGNLGLHKEVKRRKADLKIIFETSTRQE